MDTFQAIANWEVAKTKLNKGNTTINGDMLIDILNSLPEKNKEILEYLYNHHILLSKVASCTIKSKKSAKSLGYAIEKDLSSIAKQITNRKLLLMNEERIVGLTVFTKLTSNNSMDFLLMEDYLRTTKQRRTKLYKHIKTQLVSAEIHPPKDYTKAEWKAITTLYKESCTASTSTHNFVSSQNFKFNLNNIRYICSYESIVVIKKDNLTFINADYDYSPSTNKHLHMYLNIGSKDIRKRISTLDNYIYLPLLKELLKK